MKKRISSTITLFIGLFPCLVSAQHVLQSALNLPRAGDEIIKQQVQYKDPGRSGENVIWDFGQLQTVNDEYTLTYSEPYLIRDSIYILGKDTIPVPELSDDNLFIGTEHYTMYYYRFSDSCLWALGHENAATLLQYDPPLLSGVFPQNYKDSRTSAYRSRGLYSGSVPFETEGTVKIEADACGMMILPSGDTLKQVMRTCSLLSFSELLMTEAGDSVTVHTRQETFRWYSKGYRYPIFETIRNIVARDSTETGHFETAFFFPPQEHYYLAEDEENLALREEEENFDTWEGLSYNIFPNPVKYVPLELELYLPRTATVRIQIRNTMGLIALDENRGTYPVGICNFQFDLHALPTGNYILDVWLDERLISEIIMKR
ncbi:MAG: T9SS C-terminal target domain-containing protein [Dysgonamonadaceae bacterium]|nr:T9SS C-terminal target domain-containing protein [Dysgonamonadaceae bacterium]